MSDLIDRKEAIKAIIGKTNDEIVEQQVIDAISDVPSAEPKWIPVAERLPEKDGWYLVTWEDQFKTVRGVTVSEFIEPKGLTDIGHFEGFVLREIIAWMPLPKAYKEDE